MYAKMNFFFASSDFCHLLIPYKNANNFDTDQD